MKDLTISFENKANTFQTSKSYKDIDFSDEQVVFLRELIQEASIALQKHGQLKDGIISIDKFEF